MDLLLDKSRDKPENMKRLTGFYPGSFDPVTNGHLDVIERACRLVDTLYVGVGLHVGKTPLLSDSDRIYLLRQTVDPIAKRTETEVKIVEFEGLMVQKARDLDAKLIIRGLRDTTDYNYEMQMVGMNAQMAPDLQTVFVPSSPHVRHISATLVRQIAQMGGDVTAFVPAIVLKVLNKL
ncbi:Phosphopantetheine adenylyltransferase [hydrothermal vent metagenome]|uniref:Phosphopantetheine adenylyltransferase n=1 Tax=hydrothermal vent metagenome TaxID=652676 RepID=A0A3B0TJ31_9ZZZZ